jgi:hypothetical protein
LRRLAELSDVGAGDEGLAFADQHDCFDRAVVGRFLHSFDDALADLLRQRVHRSGIDRENSDIAFDGEIGDGVDSPHQCVSHTECLK